MRVAEAILKKIGFKVQGALPSHGPYLLAVAPHTHNIDFLYGLLGTRAMNITPKFLAKKDLLRFPMNLIMRPLGAISVDRKNPGGTTARAAALLNKGHIVALLPKGKRGPGQWKHGLRYMAQETGAKVYLMSIDHGRKTLTCFGPYEMTGNADLDGLWFASQLQGVTGYVPENTDTFEFEPRKEQPE